MLHRHELPIAAPVGSDTGSRDLAPRILDATARELVVSAWALGVRASELRRPPTLSARELELLDFTGMHAQRIARVLSGVFDFLYLDGGRELPVDPRPCELGAVCESAIEELREIGFRGRITYESDGDGHGEWDPGRLSQAISYLVELAARHASPADSVSLRWRGDAESVVLRVEAGRRGVPAEIAPDFGDAIADVDESGLEALLARRIALAHGGALARFTGGGGISFVLELPRCAPEHPEHAVES
ncbi:sensor histidine kinase [Anaeromyxobacter oryzae]|uniref:Histidine kinase/HSP90-like ATPase domain-containing protein n=1 Tax=Anaeromyxobacter oryzae TaxID=2918170 RepID=A0ABN6MZ15_9BACT|nr:ATP-binding protein [Anaeromyxobacter oryzae]BDG04798.1 hypothetical protein AMOR_37940 [Anaeromyxobacter oryzae]